MATLVKTPSGTWKALIRKTGWPTVAKTFRTKRDAEDFGSSVWSPKDSKYHPMKSMTLSC
ncbi:hypothetical protein V2K55_25290 [Pseudomonas alliivorans]|nr:hypothetical protein [Pseudomonas alliivorans]MEE4780709.1 hypothetical protein [Pseudomonas alliivorans]MEE5062200.1 hypothetical protein [Pseudomonas alliivorans]